MKKRTEDVIAISGIVMLGLLVLVMILRLLGII